MSRSFALDDALHAYVVAHSTPLDPVQTELVETTARLGDVAGMQTGPDQVVLLTLLTRAIGARGRPSRSARSPARPRSPSRRASRPTADSSAAT